VVKLVDMVVEVEVEVEVEVVELVHICVSFSVTFFCLGI